VRSRQLETALTEFVAQAGNRLQADIDSGAEVGFELAEKSARRGGNGARMYCYRALSGEFIQQRAAMLASLAAHGEARQLLEGFEGLDRYLVGMDGAADLQRMKAPVRAAAALRLLLEDVFEEQTDFEPRPERVEAALARLEQSARGEHASEVTLLATLHGLTIASEELALTKGLTIAQPGALRGVPEEAGSETGHLLVVFSAGDGEDLDEVLVRGKEVLKDLLRALRLFGDGRVTLGGIAWTRVTATARWASVALGEGGRPHGMLVVSAEQEDELRAFCNLVSRRAPHGNELAWALRRFELGCERTSGYEALSDHLMALRALLEPEGPASGLLAGRIAALCAMPEGRAKLTKRMIKAQALERAIIAGTAPEQAAGLNLARDVADHLRALLRDVICGHLDPDLALLADELCRDEDSAEEQAIGQDAAAEAPPSGARHSRPQESEDDPLERLAQSALPV
jgi:hypothetical protein